MAVDKTINLNIDTGDSKKDLREVADGVKDIGKTSKKTEKDVGKISKGFKGVGLAMKAAGIGLVLAVFNKLSEAMMKNQVIADAVETVFNTIGIAFKMVTDTLVTVYEAVAESSDNFDAMGKVIKGLFTISLTPLKLAFDGIKLGIQKLQLVWEKSVFGGKGKDKERIAELTESIEATKESLKETALEAVDAGKSIVKNAGEAIGEIVNIGEIVTKEFKKTFEGVTVNSIIKQGKAITATKKNYELLALAQQRLVEKYDLEAETQRGIRDDIRLTVDERIAANNELAAVLKRQSEAEKAAIQSQIDSVIELEKLEGVSNERTAERFALETELLAIDAKVKGFQAEQLTNEAGLQDERIANIQELSSIGKTELDSQLNDIEIQAEQKRELAKRTISDAKELQDTLIAINNDAAKQKEKIEKEVFNTKVALVAGALGTLSGILGEESKAGKALAVGQALINTYQGATKALAQGGIFGGVAAVGVVAAGMSSVKKILSTKLPGATDSPAPGLGTPDLSTPSLQEGGIGGNLIPNMESIIPGGANGIQPVQAYVVENDISNSQALQEELDIQATL